MTDDHTYAATLSSPDTNNNSTIRHGGWICSGQANIEEYPQLKVWLPNQYRYHACHFEVVPSLGDHTAFDATVRVDVGTVEQAQEWLIKLKESSGVTWRVDVTRPRLGRRVLLKASYKCQRRVNVKAANSRTSTKNTCCPAKIHILLKCASGQMSKTKDPHMPDFPFEVRIVNRHNHNLYVADALRHRDVGEKAKEILTGLFEIGHSPTSALAVLKHDLQMEYGERFLYASANREICPDLPYVQRLFHKVCRAEYGAQKSLVEDMIEDLKRRGQDPIFSAGLIAMAKQYHLLKANPSKLLSAIHTFGKSCSLTSKRAATLRRAARRQATAVAHRKLGAGSKRQHSDEHPVKCHSLSTSVAFSTTLAKKH